MIVLIFFNYISIIIIDFVEIVDGCFIKIIAIKDLNKLKLTEIDLI